MKVGIALQLESGVGTRALRRIAVFAKHRLVVAGAVVTMGSGLLVLGFLAAMAGAGSTRAAVTPVSLLTAQPFALLAGTAITDVPTSAIKGDVGLSPTTGAGIGVPCAEVTGKIYSVDAAGPLPCRLINPGLLTTAKNDLTAAYGDAAGRPPTVTFGAADNQLGGQTLVPGVYRFGHATTANLIGTLTLNAKGDPDAIWIFQATSDLVTASSSEVALINGAQACNVFWQVSSSATLGSSSTFIGTILALTSVSVNSSVAINGRLLARNGAVTLIMDTITRRGCAAAPPPPTTATTTTPTTTAPTTTATAPTTTATAPTTTAPTTTATIPSTTPRPTPKPKPKPKPRPKRRPATKPKPKPSPVGLARPAKHPHGFTG